MSSIKSTRDGKYIGIKILEVYSFPEQLYEGDESFYGALIKEFRTTFIDSNANIELLWLSSMAEGQVYKASIRLFLILREINSNKDTLENKLNSIQINISSIIRLYGYEIKVVEDVLDIKKLLHEIDDESIYLIKKKERVSFSPNSPYPIFFNDLLKNNNYESLDSLVTLLSDMPGSSISFQLFPAKISTQEYLALGDLCTLYSQLRVSDSLASADFSVQNAFEYVKNYYDSFANALYYFNIVIMGQKRNIYSLNSRVMSMLRCKDNSLAETELVDISSLRINFFSQFFNYPWKFLNCSIDMLSRQSFSNEVQRMICQFSIMITDSEANNFFRLPIRNQSTLVLKGAESYELTEQLDKSLVMRDIINFGTVSSVNQAINIGCPKEYFTRHALIVGTPGTGKTTFSLNLLLQFYQSGVPFLAIEPTKAEYRALIKEIPDLQIFTPGNNEVSPFIINPFVPPKGITVEQYVPALFTAFRAAFSMQSPLDVIFLKAIRTSYTEYGWKDYSKYGDEDVEPFGLYEFINVFRRLIKESTYNAEVKGNLESAGLFRLSNLIDQNGNIYDNINNIPIEDILSNPTIIELNSIQGNEQKALIMALLLSTICTYTKITQMGDGKIKNIMLIDEAHVLLDNDSARITDNYNDAKGITIKSLQSMIAEIRSYGTGIIIADQSAEKVSREIVANTDIKIVFRLVEKHEKDIISNSINASEKVYEKISLLKKGEAFMFLSNLESPQLIHTCDIRKEKDIPISVPDKYIIEKNAYWKSHKDLLKPYRECRFCLCYREECSYKIRIDAGFQANRIIRAKRSEIRDKKEFIRHIKGVNVLIKSYLENYGEEAEKRQLLSCAMIQFRRKCQQEMAIDIKDSELMSIFKTIGGDANE